ncbi:MAG: hypothetical protein KDD69_16870, partial [Bdellovibrionales bacterium]|nr:hypothetical protein [Bdellovibrionales bacterium]
DLHFARALFAANRAPENLKRYLGARKPSARNDLLREPRAVGEALAPSKMPLARWPAAGRHPLVALQQAAVNLAADDLVNDGILAVNGPPGTGKTTLLRDIVAHVVTNRARVMSTFDDPERAFGDTGLRIKKGNAFLRLYTLDERLRGSEIVVASSNNKAVENVSAELPARSAVASDAFETGYFKKTSDALLERDTWGLIAAVLGNAVNRSRFRQRFWWDDHTGISRYLQYATGTPTLLVVTDLLGGKVECLPEVVVQEKPPFGRIEALKRWEEARQHFREVESRSKRLLEDAELSIQLPRQLAQIGRRLEKLRNELAALVQKREKTVEAVVTAESTLHATRQHSSYCAGELAKLHLRKPGWVARLFRLQRYRAWLLEFHDAFESNAKAARDQHTSEVKYHAVQRDRQCIEESVNALQIEQAALNADSERCAVELARVRAMVAGTPIDDKYFSLSHRERQLAAPWFGKEASRIRDEVFEAAVKLQQAFIDAAAKPLRHNLGLLMDSFGMQSFGAPEKDAVIPHLWSSLFLVVPVVSTTFASVARMFKRIAPEEFGWLLIDEAGQALPQAAVGAVTRCRRAVIVGDPLQIEPVVVLPEQLTEAICKEFDVDETRFNAPSASAQTLADAASSQYSTFETKVGARDVGIPLLVHRRCAEPMFSISNAIAYENLMVQAKAPKDSPIAKVLGPARWLDVCGDANDKWCEAEGRKVLEMLHALRASGCRPDVYIVTPFVVVQHRMREQLRKDGVLDDWVDDPSRWLYERIGTVHTVQGREAEAVILILGAPLADQVGARGWAGGRPNLLNVAVSRAQEVLYVVGNRELWRSAGVFSELSKRLP